MEFGVGAWGILLSFLRGVHGLVVLDPCNWPGVSES